MRLKEVLLQDLNHHETGDSEHHVLCHLLGLTCLAAQDTYIGTF